MKKTNFSLNKKIMTAASMLLLSTFMLSSATYAWFTMNTEVSVTGMQMKTVVSSNLQIDDAAPTNGGSWLAGSFATDDSTFKNSTTQTIADEVLVPVSTVDGYSYWFTQPDNVQGNGDATTDAYTAYTLSALQSAYGPEVTHGYLDYHFVLKATNTTASAQNIVLNKLDMTYAGTNADTDVAWRVAILGKQFSNPTVNGAKELPDIATAGATVKKIYTPAGATNFTSGQAVKSATALDTVTYENAASSIFVVPANTTQYYEVIVRVWLEGEDTTCYTGLFNDLQNGTWSLDLGFKLEANTADSVYNIAKLTPTPTPPAP